MHDSLLSSGILAARRTGGGGGMEKEGSQVVKIVGTTSTAFGIRKINISTITTDNTNINNNNSKHLCKASCSSGIVLNILFNSSNPHINPMRRFIALILQRGETEA